MKRAQGDLPTAVQMLESCLEVERRVLGQEHPGTLNTSLDLAATLHMQGREAEARSGWLQCVPWARPTGHPTGKIELQRARRLLRETLEAQRRTLGPEHPRTVTTQR